MYIYIYIYIHKERLGDVRRAVGAAARLRVPRPRGAKYYTIIMIIIIIISSSSSKRELEYRTPRFRSHSPVDSRRFPEMFGDFCENKTGFL